VRAGGTILYCTCSLQPEEGPDRIAAALKRHPSLARLAVRPEELFGFKELVTPEGDLRSLPSHLAHLGGIDGFYAARLIRQG
jgi:16S rRNA (cytosine967-C5)-methyltransferase